MDIIKMARDLGKAMQSDERYVKYQDAKKKNDADKPLQDQIGEFNLKRMELNALLSQDGDKDSDKISELDSAIKSLYGNIMATENITEYNEAKNNLDLLLKQINMVITGCANGEDPETCPCDPPSGGCGSGCSSCAGCS